MPAAHRPRGFVTLPCGEACALTDPFEVFRIECMYVIEQGLKFRSLSREQEMLA